MKKILLLILITAFIGCETEPKLAGQFLVGQDGAERKLELGSDEDAMFIKEAVLGWAAKEYEKIGFTSLPAEVSIIDNILIGGLKGPINKYDSLK